MLAATASLPPLGTAEFVYIVDKSRFAYVTGNGFDRTRKYFPQLPCCGVAAFDYDNDGLLDLFFTNGWGLATIHFRLKQS